MKIVEINSETPGVEHIALLVGDIEKEGLERIFFIKADGTFVLRGKEIAVDKEVADILIRAFSNLPPKIGGFVVG